MHNLQFGFQLSASLRVKLGILHLRQSVTVYIEMPSKCTLLLVSLFYFTAPLTSVPWICLQ